VPAGHAGSRPFRAFLGPEGARPGVRGKLVLLALLIVVVVSFGFTFLQLRLTRGWVEEDLRERAVLFAREIAATIGDRREFESGPLLRQQIQRITEVRRSVLQLDILRFEPHGTSVVASSHPERRLAFTQADGEQTRRGRVVSRLVTRPDDRFWEVLAPITLEGAVAGGVAVTFSLERADLLSARIGAWSLALTAVSVVVMGVLMSLAVGWVVNRPIRRFMDAIGRVRRGDSIAVVEVVAGDEFGVLAHHFNEMMARIHDFNDELQTRVKEATLELEGRYQEVERLRELLFAMQRDLGRAERLALSGRIMAEVAHEVGTPLHSVAGHLELLRQDLPPALLSESVARRLDIIEGQLARVTEIIAQLLDLTRRVPREPAPVDLNRLVRDTAELVRPGIARAGLTLHVSCAAGVPAVLGDGRQLQQVVLNLLTNAMDATAPGGSVRVVTRPHDEAPAVELEVTDTGRGIPADQQRRIFEPFYSTKGPGRGTGLGLFISAQIVREHRGRIEVQSQEDRGATFRVRLPAVETP
jgi:signal transduction histidine kinase